MTSAQLHIGTDSKPIISGMPGAIADADAVMADIRKRVAQSLTEMVGEEDEALKDFLGQHPDWASVLDDSSVTTDGSSLEYRVLHPTAMDLEYGNPQENIVATGSLRSFAAQRSQVLGSTLVKKVLGWSHNG